MISPAWPSSKSVIIVELDVLWVLKTVPSSTLGVVSECVNVGIVKAFALLPLLIFFTLALLKNSASLPRPNWIELFDAIMWPIEPVWVAEPLNTVK